MQSTDQNNNSAEFETLIGKYGALINKVCYFYASDVDSFNDLRQEALINLWRGMSKYRGESGVSTWIYRVTLNSCVSYFRKNRRNANSDRIEDHPELITDDDRKSMLIREMYALINRLTPLDKAIILMWLDGNDYDSISEVTGINRATVGTRIHRIKGKLVEISNK